MLQLREIVSLFAVWFSIIVFCFTLFRFRLYTFRQQLLLTSVVMASLAYLIPLLHLVHYKPFLNAVSLCICFIAFFKIHWLYAILMVLSTYAFTACAWIMMIMILAGFNYQRFVQLTLDTNEWYVTGFAVFLFILSILLHRFRLGFTFVPFNRKWEPSPVPMWMKVTLSLGCLSLMVRAAASSVWKNLKPLDIGIVFLLLIVIFYFIYQKESSD